MCSKTRLHLFAPIATSLIFAAPLSNSTLRFATSMLNDTRYAEQVLELAVPAVIMLLIGTVKSVVDVEVKEETIPAMDAPIVTYAAMQNTTSYPYVLCYDNNIFLRYSELHMFMSCLHTRLGLEVVARPKYVRCF